MRALFLLLLLANLLYAAWAHWVAPPAPPAGYATEAASGPGSIRLLRELPAGATASPPALDEAELACVSIGPFVDAAGVEAAEARLAGLGFTVRRRAAREEVAVGYWVRVEGLATAEDAANALATLKAAGLADSYLVTEEGAGPLVSLGVHADAARAAGTAAAARAAGFEPRTIDARRTADVTWLDVDRQANGGLPAIEQVRSGGDPRQPPLGVRACPPSEPAAAPASQSPVPAAQP